jgi:hypothetical protein
MTSQEAYHHFFVFFSSVEDDDELGSSLSSFGSFLGAKDNDEPPCCGLLVFVLKCRR